jgi:hypothetical protein
VADSFRVFIGDWNEEEGPDWVHVDQIMSWADAHAFMVARFERWLLDDCQPCVEYAASQLPALKALAPGSEFVGDVEGEDYLIMRNEDRPDE